jgi:hypothetical protein
VAETVAGGTRTVPLIEHPGPAAPALWVAAPNESGPDLYGRWGDESPAGPTWFASQWNVPRPLPARATRLSPTAWTAGNEYARVTCESGSGSDGAPTFELTQDGVAAGFRMAPGGDSEFDLFLSPVGHGYPSRRPALLAPERSPRVASMASLTMTLGVQLRAEEVREAPGRLDFAFYTTALVLSNPRADQVLFYQVILRDTRTAWFERAQQPATQWFFTGPRRFGVNDSLAVFERTPLLPGDALRALRLEIRDRLRAALATGPEGIDRDERNWVVVGSYTGTGMEGEVRISAAFSGIGLECEVEQ